MKITLTIETNDESESESYTIETKDGAVLAPLFKIVAAAMVTRKSEAQEFKTRMEHIMEAVRAFKGE